MTEDFLREKNKLLLYPTTYKIDYYKKYQNQQTQGKNVLFPKDIVKLSQKKWAFSRFFWAFLMDTELFKSSS